MPRNSATPAVGKSEQGPFVDLDSFQLPAAGAYTAQAYVTLPPGCRRMHVIATYVPGAASVNGKPTCRLQWQIGGDGPGANAVADVFEAILDGTTVTKADPMLINPEYAYEVQGPIPGTPGTAFSWRLLSVEVPIKATAARVLAAEVGDTAHPGVLTTLFFTSDQV